MKLLLGIPMIVLVLSIAASQFTIHNQQKTIALQKETIEKVLATMAKQDEALKAANHAMVSAQATMTFQQEVISECVTVRGLEQ